MRREPARSVPDPGSCPLFPPSLLVRRRLSGGEDGPYAISKQLDLVFYLLDGTQQLLLDTGVG
jgi:hypothetical protein